MHQMEFLHMRKEIVNTKRNTIGREMSKLPTFTKYSYEKSEGLPSADDRYFYDHSSEESGEYQAMEYTQQPYVPLLHKTVPPDRKNIVQGVFLKFDGENFIEASENDQGAFDTKDLPIQGIIFFLPQIQDPSLIQKISMEMADKLENIAEPQATKELLYSLMVQIGEERLKYILNNFSDKCRELIKNQTDWIIKTGENSPFVKMINLVTQNTNKNDTESYEILKMQMKALEKCIIFAGNLPTGTNYHPLVASAVQRELMDVIKWKIIGYQQLGNRFAEDQQMQAQSEDLRKLKGTFREKENKDNQYFDLFCSIGEVALSDKSFSSEELEFLLESINNVKRLPDKEKEQKELLVQLIGWKIIDCQRISERSQESPTIQALLEKLWLLEENFAAAFGTRTNYMANFNSLLDPSSRWINNLQKIFESLVRSPDSTQKTNLMILINSQITSRQEMLSKLSGKSYLEKWQSQKLKVFADKINTNPGNCLQDQIKPADMENLFRYINGIKDETSKMYIAQLIGRKIINDYRSSLQGKDKSKIQQIHFEFQKTIENFKGILGNCMPDFDDELNNGVLVPTYRFVPSATYAEEKSQLVPPPTRDELDRNKKSILKDVPIKNTTNDIRSIAKDILKYLMQSESSERLVIFRGMLSSEAISILQFYNSGQAANVEKAIMLPEPFFSIREKDYIPLGLHYGDSVQTSKYISDSKDCYVSVRLAFILKPNAKDLIFSKSFSALPKKWGGGTNGIAKAEESQGTNPGHIGIKFESSAYSFAAGDKDAKLLLQLLVDRVEVIDIYIPNRKNINPPREKIYSQTPTGVYYFSENITE